MPIGYKFMRKTHGRLTSVYRVRHIDNFGYRTGYFNYSFVIKNKRRKFCGPFCLFGSLKSIKDRNKYIQENIKLFKVRYKKSKETYVYSNHNPSCSRLDRLLEGTILADEFEILEEVKLDWN